MNDMEKVTVFNVGVFHRPDRFIQCVLQTHARKQFKDLHSTKLDAQVRADCCCLSGLGVTITCDFCRLYYTEPQSLIMRVYEVILCLQVLCNFSFRL